jgi:hypothetical protein
MNGILSAEGSMALLYLSLDERGLMPSSLAISTWKHCEYQAVVDTVLALAFPDTLDDANRTVPKTSGPVTVQECATLLERLDAHGGELDSHSVGGAMAVNASWNRRHNTEQMNLFVIVETELKLHFRQYRSVLDMQKEPA